MGFQLPTSTGERRILAINSINFKKETVALPETNSKHSPKCPQLLKIGRNPKRKGSSSNYIHFQGFFLVTFQGKRVNESNEPFFVILVGGEVPDASILFEETCEAVAKNIWQKNTSYVQRWHLSRANCHQNMFEKTWILWGQFLYLQDIIILGFFALII